MTLNGDAGAEAGSGKPLTDVPPAIDSDREIRAESDESETEVSNAGAIRPKADDDDDDEGEMFLNEPPSSSSFAVNRVPFVMSKFPKEEDDDGSLRRAYYIEDGH